MPTNIRVTSRLGLLLVLGMVAGCQEVVPPDPAEEMRTLSIHLSGTGSGSIQAGIAAENGSSCAVAAGSSCELRYPAGTGSVSLTATPNAKSIFTGWGGSCTGTGSCAVNMSSSRDVSADFKAIPDSATLAIDFLGTGGGTVTTSRPGSNGSTCTTPAPTPCRIRYEVSSAPLIITPTAASGSVFASWGGACSGSSTCSVTMTEGRTVSARFDPLVTPTNTVLTIRFSGTGAGTVLTSIAGTNGNSCTTPSSTLCQISYPPGTQSVTLSATAASGSAFSGWSGDCSGSSCTVSMTANHDVTAAFQTSATPTSCSVSYCDSFDGGLANWNVVTGNWTTSNGTLTGEYDISCGSSSCSQGDLLLKDSLQPTGDWKIEAQTSSVRYPYSAGYDLTYALATFSVYASANERLVFSAGWGINNAPMPQTIDSVQVYVSRGMPWQALSGSATRPAAVWTPSQWNTVALEKIGTTYKLYFNGVLMETTTATLSVTPKVGFHVYGRMLVDNFKLTRY